MSDLTFGVELEFVANPDRYADFCQAMREAVGIDRFMDPMRYGCSSTAKWSLQRDGSVNPTSTRTNKRGYELTSPVLKWDDSSKRELSKVLGIITSVFEGIVNRTCGTHIHIGGFARIQNTDPFNAKVLRFQRLYGRYEASVFDRLVAPSRRANNNHYCKSCDQDIISRYYKINARRVFIYGTLENRQHQGTLETQKIWSWIELNAKFILAFFNNEEQFVAHLPMLNTPSSLESFMEYIGLEQSTMDFFLMREAELNCN